VGVGCTARLYCLKPIPPRLPLGRWITSWVLGKSACVCMCSYVLLCVCMRIVYVLLCVRMCLLCVCVVVGGSVGGGLDVS
jgi:hypothetical protein